MRIFRPSELKEFLEVEGVAALKGLSQNFLIDGNIIRKILAAARVEEGDAIIEIGPGPGALTEALLEQGASVIAIELDRKFAKLLERLQTPDHRLTVFQEDALKTDLKKLFSKGKRAKLVSNLPYHLTTPLIERFLPLHHQLESLTVMVQKEVGQRMTALPGTKNTSSLSLFVRLFSDPRYCFDVSPSCFYPKPSVTSAVVQLLLHAPLAKVDPVKFEKLLRTVFGKRRKMLRSSLKGLVETDRIPAIFERTGIAAEARPEELSMEQFLTFYEAVFSC